MHARFAANIMVFMARDDIDSADVDALLKAMTVIYPCPSLDGTVGVLYLRTELSTSTDEGSGFDPDHRLQGFDYALPIPDVLYAEPNGRPRFLPGAPTALEKGHHVIDDTHALLRRYNQTDDYHDIDKSVFERAHRYFTDDKVGRNVRSILSIRLRESEGRGGQSIGVVNIHCDVPNIFTEEWVLLSYLYLTTPTLARLSELLKRKQALTNQLGDPLSGQRTPDPASRQSGEAARPPSTPS